MLKKRKILILTLILLAILIIFCAFNTKLMIRTYKMETSKSHTPFRIGLITDLHSCDYGQGQRDLLNAIDAQNPDLLLLGGDIADDILAHDNTIAVIKEIGKKYPSYYVSGNHEYWSNEIDTIKQMFETYGVKVLEGEAQQLAINNETINIVGIDDVEVGYDVFLEQLETGAKQADPKLFTILLSHRPEYINEYLKYDFDLITSGHAHGGQWRLPGLINGLYAPNQGLFPKYAGGQYIFDDTQFIVSRGLARESTRIPRIFNRPELVMIDVVPSN